MSEIDYTISLTLWMRITYGWYRSYKPSYLFSTIILCHCIYHRKCYYIFDKPLPWLNFWIPNLMHRNFFICIKEYGHAWQDWNLGVMALSSTELLEELEINQFSLMPFLSSLNSNICFSLLWAVTKTFEKIAHWF